MPELLTSAGWLTFGRVRTAHLNAVNYGWASLALIGVALWIIPRLVHTELRWPRVATAGDRGLEHRPRHWHRPDPGRPQRRPRVAGDGPLPGRPVARGRWRHGRRHAARDAARPRVRPPLRHGLVHDRRVPLVPGHLRDRQLADVDRRRVRGGELVLRAQRARPVVHAHGRGGGVLLHPEGARAAGLQLPALDPRLLDARVLLRAERDAPPDRRAGPDLDDHDVASSPAC